MDTIGGVLDRDLAQVGRLVGATASIAHAVRVAVKRRAHNARHGVGIVGACAQDQVMHHMYKRHE